jgi:molybdopterin synthase catalytic subunit
MISTQLLTTPLSFDIARNFIKSPSAGAQTIFAGTVRNHNLGKKVNSLEYSAYTEMAEKMLKDFALSAMKQFQVEKIYIAHRIGHLMIEDAAVLIAVSSKHRDEGYKASRFLIEEIKHQLPVWKKEHYEGEIASWVQCSHHQHFGDHHDEH